MAQVGAVQGQPVQPGAYCQRRPGSKAEVGVDYVKALAAVAAAQRARRRRVAAGREGEALQFELRVAQLAQRFELVANEAAKLRPVGRGPHVGDDQNTHLVLIVHVMAVDSRAGVVEAAAVSDQQPTGVAMTYRLQGRIHATIHGWRGRLSESCGQGTVEYVALILLVAGVLAGVIVAGKSLKGGGIAQTVVAKLKEAIDAVGSAK